MIDENRFSGEFYAELIVPSVHMRIFDRMKEDGSSRKCSWVAENQRKERVLSMIKNYKETKPLVVIYSLCDEGGTWHRLAKTQFIQMDKSGRFKDEIDHESEDSVVNISFTFNVFGNKRVDPFEIKGELHGNIDYETGKAKISFIPDEVSAVRMKIYTPNIKKE